MPEEPVKITGSFFIRQEISFLLLDKKEVAIFLKKILL
jgi:hypothetical protein